MRAAVVSAAIAAPFLVGAAMAAGTAEGETVLTFADQQINESSGLVVLDDLAITVNDSGDSARVFAVDPATGETTSVISYGGTAVDVEALAPAAGGERAVWVADIGDNRAVRPELSVVKVPVPTSPGPSVEVAGERFPISWADGPADTEALMVHPASGQMYAVTKGVGGGQVLKGPTELSATGPNVFEPVATAPGLVTDGAFFSDGEHFVLRNYGRAFVFETATMVEVGRFDLPSQEQGEGIAVTPGGEVWISTEGIGTDVLRVPLPAEVAAAVGVAPPEGAVPTPTGSAGPGDGGSADAEEPPGQDGEPGQEEVTSPEVMPWILGTLFALVMLVVLVRSLRPH